MIAPREAAEQLVVLLYYGLLRRKIVDQFDQGYVEVVERDKRAGIEKIAETIFESHEFRESAFRRAEERHGTPRRGGKAVTELLLGDFYLALYGRARAAAKWSCGATSRTSTSASRARTTTSRPAAGSAAPWSPARSSTSTTAT